MSGWFCKIAARNGFNKHNKGSFNNLDFSDTIFHGHFVIVHNGFCQHGMAK